MVSGSRHPPAYHIVQVFGQQPSRVDQATACMELSVMGTASTGALLTSFTTESQVFHPKQIRLSITWQNAMF